MELRVLLAVFILSLLAFFPFACMGSLVRVADDSEMLSHRHRGLLKPHVMVSQIRRKRALERRSLRMNDLPEHGLHRKQTSKLRHTSDE
jgi:hypothetical protein